MGFFLDWGCHSGRVANWGFCPHLGTYPSHRSKNYTFIHYFYEIYTMVSLKFRLLKKTFWRGSWHPFFLQNDEKSAVYQPKRLTTTLRFHTYLTKYRSILTTWTSLKQQIGKKVDEQDVTGQNAQDSRHLSWKYILLFDKCNQKFKKCVVTVVLRRTTLSLDPKRIL